MMEAATVEVRGELLPLKLWEVEVLADGRAMVSVTAHQQHRQYYMVQAEKVRSPA